MKGRDAVEQAGHGERVRGGAADDHEEDDGARPIAMEQAGASRCKRSARRRRG